jgi:ribonuclease P protein component
MIIAKRNAARAATRNALKRVIREAFRTNRYALPPADYVVRLHSRIPELSLTALKAAAKAEVAAHFKRLVRS